MGKNHVNGPKKITELNQFVKKSSIDWLEDELKLHLKEITLHVDYEKLESLFNIAREKHRDDVIDARTNGKWLVTQKWGEVRTNQKYYNQTFNKE